MLSIITGIWSAVAWFQGALSQDFITPTLGLYLEESDFALFIRIASYSGLWFSLSAFPKLQNKRELIFSEIENALLEEQIDLGLIIHENRFTYEDKGLKKIIDLGSYWEEHTGWAIPLGGIVINRKLDQEIQEKVNRLIRKSVEYAFENPKSGIDFIRQHAQEMSEEVMYKHIELYVNKYSVDHGAEGRTAIDGMFELAQKNGIIPPINQNIYLNP